MIHRPRWALLVASALGCTLAAEPGFAQAETDTARDVNPADQALAADAPNDPNTIIVTARRFEERLQDVPISITVFNQEQLNNRNIVNPSELATYTPSLSVNRQYGSEKSSFSIRGFTQELGTQPSVGVYFADVVAPRAQGPTPSGNGTLPGTLFDLENIQVLKGPQGTLFGRNTTGGAILIVPRKPVARNEGYLEATLGNHDTRRFQAVANATLGERARFRIGVDRMTRDGYQRNRSGIGPNDFADVDYWAVRGSLVVDLADNLENYTIATFNDSNTHGQLPRIIACAGNFLTRTFSQVVAQEGCAQLARQTARGDGFYDVENSVPDPQVHLKQWQVINTTKWDVSDTLTIKNIASYSEFRERTRINLIGDNLAVPSRLEITLPRNQLTGDPPGVAGIPFLPPIPGAVAGGLPTGALAGSPFVVASIQPGPSGNNAAQYNATEELQFQGRTADERFNWQAGGYLEISRPLESGTQLSTLFATCTNAAALQCFTPLAFFRLGGSLSLIDQRYRFRNLGVYAQATYKLTDQFSLTGGIRYTSDRTSARSQNAAARFVNPVTLAPSAPIIVCSESGASIASFDQRGTCIKSAVEKSSKPTWLIDLDFKPSDDVLLYAKYARGYRQGTINLLPFGSALVRTGPEKVDTYEVGAKTSFDGPIPGNINITAFYNDFSNQQLQANTQVRRLDVFPVNVIVNAGKSRIYGLELDASVRPFAGFQLDVAYAYLNTRLKSINLPDLSTDPNYSGVIPTAALGGPLVYSPKNKVSVTASYTLPLEESVGRVMLSATFTHTDKQFASHADDPFVANGQLPFNPGLLPATDLLNLNVNWNNVADGPVDLSLFATNVTKKKYRVAIFQLFQAGFESALLGEPRMYGLRARVRFGD